MRLQPGVYRHYKGRFYRLLGEARHAETGEELVVYQALYGERGWWVRPRSMFVEEVITDQSAQPRFAYFGEKLPDEAGDA